ncbi:hypothetical protein DITRI_Ditri03aG0022500 [Diplodiscus trichospermus]
MEASIMAVNSPFLTNSALFTHLICAFASLDSSSYELSISSSDEPYFSVFTNTVKQKNPSITILLSIGGGSANHSVIVSMVSNSSHRKAFIDSSIKVARLYDFQGLEFSWVLANTRAYDFHTPTRENFTRAHAALYDPASNSNTNFGIESWINGGLPANKLVLGLPFYGYAWRLVNPKDNTIGATASGTAISVEGDVSYKDITTNYVERYEANLVCNATYVVNYCSIGETWIGFDDVEAVKVKVSYAKEKKLLGYVAWQVSHYDNWVLSQAGMLALSNLLHKYPFSF